MANPRFCRPSWAETIVDDRKPKGTGPELRDGTLTVVVKVRDNGKPADALRVQCCGVEDCTKVQTTVTLLYPFTTEVNGERVTLPTGTILGMATRQ